MYKCRESFVKRTNERQRLLGHDNNDDRYTDNDLSTDRSHSDATTGKLGRDGPRSGS